jgi:peptidyl-prolyl cis-trans isomerase SurA
MMHKPARRLIAQLVVAGVVSPWSAGGGPAPQGVLEQGILEQIVVTVNGEIITKTEIDERLRITSALTADPAAGADPGLLTRVLRDAIDERLMTQRAVELGLDARTEDVDRVLAAVRTESHVDSDAAFSELLEREGMSLATLRVTTRRRLLIEQVSQHLIEKLSVTDAEALRYYDTHRSEFTKRATVRFREVRIAVPPRGSVSDTERDRALVKVVKAGDQLNAGVEFETVAEAYSESATRTSGGLVGPVEPTALEPLMLAALIALEPGATSGPVETADGYCFLKMEGRDPASAPTFGGNREPLIEMLLAMKQRAALEDLLERMRGAAILQWKRRDLRAAYERSSR